MYIYIYINNLIHYQLDDMLYRTYNNNYIYVYVRSRALRERKTGEARKDIVV